MKQNIKTRLHHLWVWFMAAWRRAVRTFAQTMLGYVVVASVITDVNWKVAGSAALVAAVASLLTSVGGLPELSESEDE